MVRRGLTSSRTDAQRAVEGGGVFVDGAPAAKPSRLVGANQVITVEEARRAWASRAADKLVAALDAFAIDVEGASALDVGASTGGFTDVLLQRGARRVVAVDVGYGQLIWRLRQDPRVVVHDRTNFRLADPAALGAPFDVVVMDVAFIGAAVLAPNLAACGAHGTVYVVLVKPQFEVGPDRVGRGGIVVDSRAHEDAVASVTDALHAVGVGVLAAMPSPVKGTKGNQEFLLHAVHGAAGRDPRAVAAEAVA